MSHKSDVLDKAKSLIEKIFDLTNELSFTGLAEDDEKEVNAYAALMEERQPLVDELMKLKESIDSEMAASEEFAGIKKTLLELDELDKAHMAYIQTMRETVKDAYKVVKQGQRIHDGYTSLPPGYESQRLDVKQ